MRRVAIVLFALISLTGCRLHDDYTGEPFFRLEYTVEGEHFVYEDWGRIERGFLNSSFAPVSFGTGLYSRSVDANESVACFELWSSYLSLRLESDWRFFTDGKRYEYREDPQKQGLDGNTLHEPQEARITEGWYSFTRKCSEPYGVYEICFGFKCHGNDGFFEITDGIIKVGRRLQADVKDFIKSEQRP